MRKLGITCLLLFVLLLVAAALLPKGAKADERQDHIYAMDKDDIDDASFASGDFVFVGEVVKYDGGEDVYIEQGHTYEGETREFFWQGYVFSNGGAYSFWLKDDHYKETLPTVEGRYVLHGHKVSTDHALTESQLENLNDYFVDEDQAVIGSFTIPVLYPEAIFLVTEYDEHVSFVVTSEHPVHINLP